MAFVQRAISIGANSFTEDLLLANNIPFTVSAPTIVRIGMTAGATGIFVDIFVGPNDVAQNFSPSTQNRIPIIPDDYPLAVPMLPGDYMKLRVRSTAGAAVTLFLALQADG